MPKNNHRRISSAVSELSELWGISWTLNGGVALWFANRRRLFTDDTSYLLKAEIPKERVAGVFNGAETEVLLFNLDGIELLSQIDVTDELDSEEYKQKQKAKQETRNRHVAA